MKTLNKKNLAEINSLLNSFRVWNIFAQASKKTDECKTNQEYADLWYALFSSVKADQCAWVLYNEYGIAVINEEIVKHYDYEILKNTCNNRYETYKEFERLAEQDKAAA